MRKWKDKALRTNAESAPNLVYYQTLMESLSDGCMLIDTDAFLNSSIYDLIHPEDESRIMKRIKRLEKGKT